MIVESALYHQPTYYHPSSASRFVGCQNNKSSLDGGPADALSDMMADALADAITDMGDSMADTMAENEEMAESWSSIGIRHIYWTQLKK
jgi:hypothetical protein